MLDREHDDEEIERANYYREMDKMDRQDGRREIGHRIAGRSLKRSEKKNLSSCYMPKGAP